MLAKFSVQKPFTVLVAVVLIIILGVVSFTNMTPDLLPSIEMPMVMVVTTYIGASPEEVENEVTKPLEQSLSTLENIKSVSSTSNANASMLQLQFNDGINMDTAIVHIREKIEAVRGGWGPMIGNPFILNINPDIIPVTVAVVEGENLSVIDLSSFVTETLIYQLEGIEGVAAVTVSGNIQESVHIVLNQDKIIALNEKVRAAIEANFEDYESGIRSGLGSAYSGRNAANAGKDEIIKGQKQLAEQMQNARVQLTGARAQLTLLQIAAPALIQAQADVAAAQVVISTKEAAVQLANPAWTHEQVVAECLLDPDYAQAVTDLQLATDIAAQFGMTLNDLPDLVAQAQNAGTNIAAVDQALSELGIQEAVLTAQLGNLYADATAGAMVAQLTIVQLQQALTQIEDQKESAIAGGDVSAILSIDMISKVLTAQNFSMPAGYIGSDKDSILVTVGDKFKNVAELQDLVLVDMGFEDLDPIKLSDIADVFTADNSADVYGKINGNSGVLLSFSKQSGFATATVSSNIQQRFNELSEKYGNVRFTPLMDQGDYIKVVVNSVLDNLLIGGLLAIVILFLFLRDWRPTMITALSIPISVTFAIVLMYFSGVTLNVISLAGLAVGVGMLVDNSIVVVENIYRLRGLGLSPIRAAMSGAAQVAGAITSSTLTTICVFFPIVFIQGITRQLFADIALTIGYSLLASLIIALTLVPALSSGLLRKDTNPTKPGGFYSRFLEKYVTAIKFGLKHKFLFMAVTVVLLVVSLLWSISMGFQYMPEMSSDEIMVNIEMPEEFELADTAKLTDEICKELMELDTVESVGAMLSGGMASIIGLSDGSTDVRSIILYVIAAEGEAKQCGIDVQAVCHKYEDRVNDISANGSTNIMSFMTALGGEGVSVQIFSNDLKDLRNTALDIAEILRGVEGIGEVSGGAEEAQSQITVTVDKNKAMAQSLTVAQVYMEIVEMLSKSQTPTEIVYNGEGHDVVVRSLLAEQMDIHDIRNAEFTVENYSGETVTVKLADIATITESETLASISRAAQRRYLSVSGTIAEGYNTSLVAADVKTAVDAYKLAPGVSLEYSGESETIMDSLRDLLNMLLLGVAIVYLIMVAQFQSLLSPFIVMFTIPLAFTGGLFALIFCGMNISIVAMIGFVMLVGIIVNNGIVLVDYINTLRREGTGKQEAIIEAGVTRLRPIIMTALTTVLGLFPLALGVGMGAELMQPVAVVCIGGLIYATLMTLFIVPIMYDLLNRKELRVVRDEDLEVVDL